MDQGEGGNMFTQRVKAVWLCLVCMDLMFSPSIDNNTNQVGILSMVRARSAVIIIVINGPRQHLRQFFQQLYIYLASYSNLSSWLELSVCS